MKKYFLPVFALLLIGAGCSSNTNGSLQSDTYYSGETQEEIESSMDARLETWEEDYQEWSSELSSAISLNARLAATDISVMFQEAKVTLEEKYEAAQKEVNEFKDASQEMWLEAKIEAEAALSDLETSYLEFKNTITVESEAEQE